MSRQRETGSALGKAVLVLDALLDTERPVGLADLAHETGLPRQTAYRIVRQLEREGLVGRTMAKDTFTAGPRLLRIGLGALAAATRSGPTRAVLRDLVASVGETCNIGVLDRDEVVYIDRVECDWPLRLQYGPGSRVPVHATAIGKLLLAHLPKRDRRRFLIAAPLEEFTDTTITDAQALEDEMRLIRKQGFSTSRQESIAGLLGLAVPVRDAGGRVVAGLAVHCPEARMSLAQAEAHLPALRAAADRLSREICDMQNGVSEAAQ